jgi:adenosylcobinamide kinase/adenosylcobinamide-phosphate guanylyltransferase
MSPLQTTLVLGGARSGKSLFAEKLVDASRLTKIYLATATAGDDDEMSLRISRHRSRRGEGWTTIEEPLALVDALTREATHGRVVLVDCLTLWLSNVMFAGRDPEVEARRLTRFLGVARYPIVFVSNEVGMGLVPETPLGRAFRDAQGRLNQIIAAAVPNVAFIAAGLPLWLKRSSEEF